MSPSTVPSCVWTCHSPSRSVRMVSKGLDTVLPACDCRGEYGIKRTRWCEDTYSYALPRQRFSVHCTFITLMLPSLPISVCIDFSAASFRTRAHLGCEGWRPVVDYGADHASMTRSASVRSYVRVRALRRTFFIFPSQVFKGHMHLRPFDRPGQADLTANVNLCT
jgi:hypothetical protein